MKVKVYYELDGDLKDIIVDAGFYFKGKLRVPLKLIPLEEDTIFGKNEHSYKELSVLGKKHDLGNDKIVYFAGESSKHIKQAVILYNKDEHLKLSKKLESSFPKLDAAFYHLYNKKEQDI